MRFFVPCLRAAVAALGLAATSGCDLAVAGYFTPGIGHPMTGIVLDATTHLPVGGASVLAGLGATVTDGQGRFKLLGNFGSREISVSRAGYIAVTYGGIPVSPDNDLQFDLEPLFPIRPPSTVRFLEVTGPVNGLASPTTPALVSLGGISQPVNNGAYTVEYRGGPGRIVTTILAWGTTNAPYVQGVAAPPAFHFLDFAYDVRHWPLGDTVPASRQIFPLTIRNQVPIKASKVSYTNLGKLGLVQTDVLLDFGVLGFVPVARATASNQQLNIPSQEGLKYVVTGEARDTAGRTSSLVELTTNDPGKAAFPLLSVPSISSPAQGEAGVGQRPTFKWSAVPGDVTYEVSLYEVGESKAKWIGITDIPEITYPGFSPADVNGGALRETKDGYTWNLRVIDLLEETEAPSNSRAFGLLGYGFSAGTPVRPYRSRKREVVVRQNGFKI